MQNTLPPFPAQVVWNPTNTAATGAGQALDAAAAAAVQAASLGSALAQEINIGARTASSIAEPGTYFEAAQLIGSNVLFSAEDCKAQCLDNQACRVWSWCPTTQREG